MPLVGRCWWSYNRCHEHWWRNCWQKKSLKRFIGIVVVVLFVSFALLTYFPGLTFFTDIVHLVELVQAVLVCTTALLALSELMIIQIKRTNVTGLSSSDMFEKTKAINTITSLALAHMLLQWVVGLSIVSISFSVFWFMFNNPAYIGIALAAFLAQIYIFIWGLVYSDFWPFSPDGQFQFTIFQRFCLVGRIPLYISCE